MFWQTQPEGIQDCDRMTAGQGLISAFIGTWTPVDCTTKIKQNNTSHKGLYNFTLQ